MEVDHHAARAPYLQVADILRHQIRTGCLMPGQQAPSQRQLVDRYKLSPSTVKKAFRVLTQEGLLYPSPGRGLYVTNTPRPYL